MNDFEKAQMRGWCVSYALHVHKKKAKSLTTKQVVRDAAEIAKFVLDMPDAEVVKLIKGNSGA
ncbi:hypothetical protein [Fimbriiglobus ruber]|uniref:Uncharacterized protein n=1 Tax=Fimbriiglobus ruber TaxID=1908690 RepID=A0A225DD78_9BACT|nr:hypothetical protein [Fimbriiglobus ruber]OWK39501.1 hypothetical protein FRUB_06064 [Fimbriiglobus ruber]